MWKDYSVSYLKNNRASGISVMAAAFIASFFLSLLGSLGYNFWVYEIERITLDEGDWQGRIVGQIDENELSMIQNFSNVEKAVVNEELSLEETVIDIYFQDVRTIYQDMPLILKQLGLEESAAEYHSLLLSRYLIHDPQEEQPPLLMAFYLGIFILASCSLILIIRNSFELSMKARVRQFGIFSSIGATPKQIRICLMQEAAALCAVPILLGSLLGIGLSFGLIEAINLFAADVSGRHKAVFQYHFTVFGMTILAAVLTVFFSAWIPTRSLSKMTPLQAIRGTGGLQAKKRKGSPILSALFGIEGELAGTALKAQRKALGISTLSLLLSFLGFSLMLTFTTLSDVSTRYTYFERYQNAWDVMVTVKDTKLADFELTEEVQKLSGAKDAVVYQKAKALCVLSEREQSDKLTALGGFGTIAGQDVVEGLLRVEAPIIVLDDNSFLEYCSQIGIPPSLEGAVILNRIWDSKNSNFRYKEYVPFVRESSETTMLCNGNQSGQSVEIPVLSYTQEAPVLRKEYDNYALVHVMPLSMWTDVGEQLGGAQADSYIRIFSRGDAFLEDLNALEEAVVQLLDQRYEIESENRVQEKISNDRLMKGAVAILGSFCVLLAIIGIANVFSNTLGFLHQRKREFAQYMSVGLTPPQMRKMFCVEAFVTAGRPLFITLPLTAVFIEFAVTVSYLDRRVFWAEAPIVPIMGFGAAIAGFVILAYYIGGKRLLDCDLNETLRNDTLL